jgi:hypothetical protein
MITLERPRGFPFEKTEKIQLSKIIMIGPGRPDDVAFTKFTVVERPAECAKGLFFSRIQNWSAGDKADQLNSESKNFRILKYVAG